MELNKAVLDCMQALRRRLRTELAVEIRLSQADAVDAMLIACLRSNDPETRALGQRLAQFLDSRETPTAAASPFAADALAAPARGALRMYRGQRVYA